MSDVEKLRQMDPVEVQKRTYIAPKILKALLDEEFERLGNYARAVGFLNILERELQLDLSELRAKIDEHFGQQHVEEVFTVLEKDENSGSSKLLIVGILLGLMAGAGAGYYLYLQKHHSSPNLRQEPFLAQSSSSESFSERTSSLSSTSSIQTSSSSSSSSVTIVIQESNATSSQEIVAKVSSDIEENETNTTESNLTEPIATVSTVTLIPKAKIWVGIIYLDDYSRKQYLTESPIELNTSKDQLIVTGHGVFDIEQNGQIVQELNDHRKQYFIYRAGTLEKIDAKSFREYNRGRPW